MDQTVQPQTAAEVAGATMTEVADAARDQYENVLGLIRKRPIIRSYRRRRGLHSSADPALKR
jgi:hypothetical protein